MSGKREPEYLGDGVYASFDGYHIWLRTGAHEGPHVTNEIALEPSVYAALMHFHERLVMLAQEPKKPTYTLIEYMPAHLRASHDAAGNSGVYPHNGAERAYVDGLILSSLLHPRWARIVEDGITELPAGEISLDDIPEGALAPECDPDEAAEERADREYEQAKDDAASGAR